jgi:hypothetical protein
MKQTLKEVTEILSRARAKRHETLDDVKAMITGWAGSNAKASEAMKLIETLQNAEFAWGVYDATRSIMRANKATKIDDGKLIFRRQHSQCD